MKVFITGVTGFVGSHLAEALIKSGHDVYGLARSSKKVKEFNIPGVIIEGDLSTSSVDKWIEKLPSDLSCIVHTAGIVHSFNTDDFYDTNTISSLNLLKKLKEKYLDFHFIFISTLAASKQVSHYGKSKKRAELLLKEECPKRWSFNTIRPPMVIGPRDPAILDIYKMVKDGLVLYPGLNAGKKAYSFVNVYDLVSLIINTIEQKPSLELINVSYPKTITFDDIIKGIKKEMGKKAIGLKVPFPLIKVVAHVLSTVHRFFPISARLTPDKTFELKEDRWISSGEEIAHKLSYQYQYDLKSSLKMTYQDYIKRNWL